MEKVFKNILLVYKKSAYSIYFIDRKIKLAIGSRTNLEKEMKRFKRAHNEHHGTLKKIEKILRDYGIPYRKQFRGGGVNYARYDLIITVGGDGTFLEASKRVKNQVILGVNSAPSYSVGKLCQANGKNFERIIRKIKGRKFKIDHWQRLRLDLEGHVRPVDCVNDILVCHNNPAAMSRYYLQIGKHKEEHRSSGIWVSTPSGSTGAIRSAGGKKLKSSDKKIQYFPRELHYGFCKHYRLAGGILKAERKLLITSLMRKGAVFVDGTHNKLNFPFNAKLTVSLSPDPLKVIKMK